MLYNFKLILASKGFIISLVFSFSLLLFEAWLFNIDYHYWIDMIQGKESKIRGYFNIVLTLTSVLLLTLGVWISLHSGRIWQVAFSFLFLLAALIEYGFQTAFHQFSTEYYWLVGYATSTEQKQNILTSFFSLKAFGGGLFFISLLFYFRNTPRIKYLKSIQASYVILFLTFFILTDNFTSNFYNTPSFCAFMRTAVALPHYLLEVNNHSLSERTKLTYLPQEKLPLNNILFIIDESVRGDHTNFYGYDRLVVSPKLLEWKEKGYLINWKECVSGATTSVPSNLMLLTGFSNDKLPDVGYDLYKMPSLFQYAKAMGYKTYYLDGQMIGFWNGSIRELEHIDVWLNVRYFNAHGFPSVDSVIATKIKTILTDTNARHFIWVNKYGVHDPYEGAYYPENTKWKPIANYEKPKGDSTFKVQKQHLVNNYDNGLLYNSTIFWNTLLNTDRTSRNNGQEAIKKNTTIVYTSDHGETLSDNGEMRPHSGSYKKEASVPLFIINKPHQFKVDTHFLPHHDNIFPTLLDLMAFPESERHFSYKKSLFKATVEDNKPRHSWYGEIFDKSFNGRIYFD